MSDGSPQVFTATEYCKVSIRDPSDLWRSKTVRALILPSLCHPMILGLPFLSHNSLVIDYASRSVSVKDTSFDLLHPSPTHVLPPPPPPISASERRKLEHVQLDNILRSKKRMLAELKEYFLKFPSRFRSDPIAPFNVVAAVKARIEQLEFMSAREKLSEAIKRDYSDVFGDIPHLDDLPTNITCKV
ncbi:hypothetical protein FB446DRAFT_640515, partial [Lentinula raphanica]